MGSFLSGLGGSLLGGLLFGGGGDGGGGTVTGQQVIPPTIEQAEALTGAQRGLLDQLVAQLSGQIGQPGRIPPTSLMPGAAGPLQQQAFGMAGGMGQLTQQALGRAGEQFRPEAITQAMQPVGEFAQNLFSRQIVPSIMGQAGAAGTSRGSGVVERLGRIGQDLSLGIASQFAPLQLQAQQANLGRQMAIPGVAGQAATSMANIGALQRGIPEQQRGFRFGQWQAGDPWQNPALNFLGMGVGTPAFTNVGFPGQAFQGFRQPSLMESLLPALGTLGGGALQGYFSQPR